MELIKEGSRYVVTGTFDEMVKQGGKDLPKKAGFRYDGTSKSWATTDMKIAGKLLDHIDMSADIRSELGNISQVIQETLELSRAVDSSMEVPCPDGLNYYGFQKAGIQFASTRDCTLIGDEMGVGKTIQSIGIINASTDIRKVLVVCPASLRLNWQRELETWLVRELSVGVGISNTLPDSDIVVINYDILDRHLPALLAKGFDMCVVDECHYIKNQKTKRYKAVASLVKSIQKKVFLSGTPVPNRPIEGYPIFNLLAPDTFRSFMGYAKRYCDAYQTRWGWDFSGASNLAELQSILRESIMIRRLKADVLTELPSKVRQVIVLPTNGLKEAIEAEADQVEMLEASIAEARSRVDALVENDDPQAYKEAVAHLHALEGALFSEMSRIRHETALAKTPYIVEHVTGLMEECAKIVVMAHHHDVVDAIADGLKEFGVVTYTGRDSMTRKDQAVHSFMNDEGTRVFIGSIQAAGVGLTLTSASTVVFAELDWVPGNMSQAEDRLHRIGQKDSVLVQHVVIDGSLDAKMAKTIMDKQAVLDAVLDIYPDQNPDDQLAEIASTIRANAEESAQKKAKLDKEAKGISAEQAEAVHDMLKILASLCDGAMELDDSGFNKFHASIGKRMALLEKLSTAQMLLGRKIVKKYHRQLPADMYSLVYGKTRKATSRTCKGSIGPA